MDRISRLVVWICSRFDREQIVRIVSELNDVLQNRNPAVLPKDDFKKNIPTTATTSSIPPRHLRPLPKQKNNPH
jgi:hypothetical protein